MNRQMKTEATRLTFTTLISSSLLFAAAFAQEKATSVNLSYASNRLLLSGLEKVDEKKPSAGLQVEISARRNGVSALKQALESSCQSNQLQENWQSGVKSLGSEIFSDRTFKILLAGTISKTFVNSFRKVNIASSDGKPLVFSIPQVIPLKNTNCGRLKLILPNGTSIEVFPGRTSETPEGAEKIKLNFSAQQGGLIPGNDSSRRVLESSNLSTMGAVSETLLLPIRP